MVNYRTAVIQERANDLRDNAFKLGKGYRRRATYAVATPTQRAFLRIGPLATGLLVAGVGYLVYRQMKA